MSADLSRLSQGERRVLALLAGGHTAKSAAAATGLSVNAVNERLREARRKTGVGSSRELARLVGPQENRDEKIGAARPGVSADTATPVTPFRWWRLIAGVLVMIVFMTVAAVFLFQQPIAQETSAALLRQRLREEPIDRRWAPSTERGLRAIYSPIDGVRDLKVLCGSTMCEVSGAIDQTQATSTVAALQDDPLVGAVRKAGLGDSLLNEFSAAAAERGARGGAGMIGDVRFVAYWRRSGA